MGLKLGFRMVGSRYQVTQSNAIDEALIAALRAAAKGNSHTAAPAAAVLWPDKEGLWQSAIPALQAAIPSLLVFGPYDPDRRCGPAIWLKCAIAGVLPEIHLEGTPIVYLPGVSRADLRAIESCPVELQQLAEQLYRGACSSLANGKDWTISAFLSSKNGGLGLEVSQDKATQVALNQALQTGLLLPFSL